MGNSLDLGNCSPRPVCLWSVARSGTWHVAGRQQPRPRGARCAGFNVDTLLFKTVKLYFVGSSRFVPLADPTVVVSLSRLRPPEARAPSPRATRGRDSPRLCADCETVCVCVDERRHSRLLTVYLHLHLHLPPPPDSALWSRVCARPRATPGSAINCKPERRGPRASRQPSSAPRESPQGGRGARGGAHTAAHTHATRLLRRPARPARNPAPPGTPRPAGAAGAARCGAPATAAAGHARRPSPPGPPDPGTARPEKKIKRVVNVSG